MKKSNPSRWVKSNLLLKVNSDHRFENNVILKNKAFVFLANDIFVRTHKVYLELFLLCLQIQGWPAAPFLLCGSSHQPHYISQLWLPGRRSRIVVVSCCDVAHCRNGHGLACTGCYPPTQKTARRPNPELDPGGEISTGPPTTHYNTGQKVVLRGENN